ncbi:MAG: pro-sigmaK processing inhibitor BofA family protein [Cellulosilyticaceae bacterium]
MSRNNIIIIAAILVCVIMLCWVLWGRQILTIIGRMLLGGVVIWGVNMLVPIGMKIGINFISLACAGALGLPGVAMLYIVNIIT